ncbi:hypothetical protein GZH47_31480 (plasmid) [Paenibacillus rhizovicinus]|uniref:Uncharacterized protein n=1 Tax=Paenibacillus rhizovicinus TaxID=2704463 RepID=A0A6C0PCV5_9BACL|nr:hypothetical protein [Paenibacillus rhizovicinus]QHW35422.1 hypothetical protein GZH47_31480 [Paenibacillus rhizovicinus]
MEVVKNFTGSKCDVWRAAREFAQTRTIQTEAGVESLSFSVRHQVGWRIWITVIHTEHRAEILLAIAGADSKKGSAKYLSGPIWECKPILAATVEQAEEVFENASEYPQRELLMEAGGICHELISRVNSCESPIREEAGFVFRIQMDEYKGFLDDEWIDEMINVKGRDSNG